MTNSRKQKWAYAFFTALGVSVLLLMLFELAVGPVGFLLFLHAIQEFFVVGFILGFCALALVAVTLAFQCRGDPVLYFLGVTTVLYVVFAADNTFYFFDLLVVTHNIIEVVSTAYAIVCIAAGIWFVSS